LLFGEHGQFVFDLGRRQVAGVIRAQGVANAEFWERVLVPIVLGTFATTLGLAPLHCASLERNGNGVLLAAQQGGGKSSLAAGLLQEGYSFVADEHSFAGISDGVLSVCGIDSPLKLLPDAARFFPQLEELRTVRSMNGEVAYEVDVKKTFAAQTLQATRPRLLLFVERSTQPGCRFASCSPEHAREFFRRNSEKLPENLPDAERMREELIKRVCGLDTWVVSTGETPQPTARAVAQFLETQWN